MSFENFRHLIDINSPFPIIPFHRGESLIHPDFIKCCQYAHQAGFPLKHIHTNLAMDLTENHFDTLAMFGVVVVNVGGGTPETHQANMKTDLNRVFSNLKLLYQRRPGLIEVKMVTNSRNLAEVNILRSKVKEISPQIRVATYPILFHAADSDEEDKRKFVEQNLTTPEGKFDGIPCRDKVEFVDGKVKVTSKLNRCYGLDTTIYWDGAVTICCRNLYHEKPVGNAFETPLPEILKSEAFKKAQKLGLDRQYIGFCRICS